MKMVSASIFLILIHLGILSYAEIYSLKTFLRQSLQYSRDMEVENANLKRMDYVIAEQRSAFLPEVNASVQYTTLGPSERRQNAYNQSVNGTSTKINLNQNLFNGLKDVNALESAKHSRQAQYYKVQEIRQRKIESALALYFKLLQVQKDIENQNQEILLYEKNLNEMKARTRSGSLRPSEVLNLEAAVANARIDLNTFENNLKLAQAEAATTLRLSDPQVVVVSFAKFSFSYEQTKSLVDKMDLARRDDLKSLTYSVQAKEENIEVQKGSYLPTLDLSGSYLVNSSDDFAQSNTYSASIVLSIPFPVSVKKSSELAKSRAEKAVAESEAKRKKEDLMKEKNQLVQSLQNNIKQIELLKKAKELNRKNVDAMGRDHRGGVVSYSDVLNASITYQKTLQKYDRALLDFELSCYLVLLWSADVEELISGIED
ncbi:MAG: TolC family protein [Bdellovibrionaceae bacterium]|nr:TolC family protein [Pseudobdellovibrionaceae bacterium]